jgi:hypothetical protein
MCRQVREQLELVFAGDFEDPLLLDLDLLTVNEGVPGTMTIWVECPPGRDANEVIEALEGAQNYLRYEIASAIHRRRVPNLRFIVQAGVFGLDGEDES